MLKHQDPGQWLSWLGLQEPGKSAVLADVAGGTGALSRWLLHARRNLDAVVLDLDPVLLDAGCRKARDEGLDKRMTFTQADASALPLNNGGVDVAFVFGALQVIPNGRQAIRELARIARTSVVVFWAVMDFLSPSNKASGSRLAAEIRTLEGLLHGGHASHCHPPSTSDLSLETVPEMMASSGLKNLRVRGLMLTIDPEEMDHETYVAYRNEECCLLEDFARTLATAMTESHDDQVNRLCCLYRLLRDELVQDHAAGLRKYLWDGGPVVIWIGDVPSNR